MKTPTLMALCWITLALPVFGQSPAAPVTSIAVPPATTATDISPPAAATTGNDDSIERSVSNKLKRRFSNVRTESRSDRDAAANVETAALVAAPTVGIIFSTLFGAPVLIVAAIMFFSYLRSRSLHRTVREMVAKGQPVPAALFAPAPRVRALSDLRRGVVLVMVGCGLMIFFGAVNDWRGGAWAIGMIPFLIGIGYLIVWKMESPKAGGKEPPLPSRRG
jgi:hypothetical protein